MKWRSVVVLAAWASGLLVPARAALAQQAIPGGVPGAIDPACACFVKVEPGEDDRGSGSDRKWILAGAAGLALLSGIPLGGGSVQGLPFAVGVGAPETPVLAAAPELPEVPVFPIEAPADVPHPQPVPGDAGGPTGVLPLPLPPVEEQRGLVPPKTATHLPLLAAAGVLMVGAGALLSRRQSRERRRRRRFVAIG